MARKTTEEELKDDVEDGDELKPIDSGRDAGRF